VHLGEWKIQVKELRGYTVVCLYDATANLLDFDIRKVAANQTDG
jgi:hypothetical protein